MSIFDSVLVKKPGRSLFNMSHERKMTANFGWLYPCMCIETVPGDTFKISTEMLVRSAPLIAPLMHRVNVKLNYFFVPNRLLWQEWESFVTGVDQMKHYEDPEDINNYFVQPVPPYCEVTSANELLDRQHILTDGSLADFLGFPTMRPGSSVAGTVKVDLLPFYAYHKIWADWFRNQNTIGAYTGAHPSGFDNDGIYYMRLHHRCWEKDYFTSVLPFAQRGDAMKIPIAQGESIKFVDAAGAGTRIVSKSGQTIYPNAGNSPINATGNGSNDAVATVNQGNGLGITDVTIDNSSNLQIDGGAIGTINDLRVATRIQRWLEKNARVGGRYIEQILGHFGINSSDSRLQRAEYLGGFTLPIVVSDVEQTSNTAGTDFSGTDTPQGTLAGKGTAYGTSKPIKCFCEEHGFLMCILSIVPRTTYQDGLPRMFDRHSVYDYYFPEFAYLGEQDVKKSEVFFDITDTSKRSTDRFGFQERYCEYKYIPSTVHGEFKGNLHFWHLGRRFNSQPSFNDDFVKCNPPQDNVFAVSDENLADHFYISLYHNVSALRPIPKHSIPTL